MDKIFRQETILEKKVMYTRLGLEHLCLFSIFCSFIAASTGAGGGAAAVIIETEWLNDCLSSSVALMIICIIIGAPQK